jgi:hypothetical protein
VEVGGLRWAVLPHAKGLPLHPIACPSGPVDLSPPPRLSTSPSVRLPVCPPANPLWLAVCRDEYEESGRELHDARADLNNRSIKRRGTLAERKAVKDQKEEVCALLALLLMHWMLLHLRLLWLLLRLLPLLESLRLMLWLLRSLRLL